MGPAAGSQPDPGSIVVLDAVGREAQVGVIGAKAPAVVAVRPGRADDALNPAHRVRSDPRRHGEVVDQAVDRAVGDAQAVVFGGLKPGRLVHAPANAGRGAGGV